MRVSINESQPNGIKHDVIKHNDIEQENIRFNDIQFYDILNTQYNDSHH
jgi:hypothetical protein